MSGFRIKAGQRLEVLGVDVGYEDSMYLVIVLEPNFLENNVRVEYKDVKDETGNRWIEIVPAERLRPLPPEASIPSEIGGLVNVYHKSGWWPGILEEVDSRRSPRTHRVRLLTRATNRWFSSKDIRFHHVFLGHDRWRLGRRSDINLQQPQ